MNIQFPALLWLPIIDFYCFLFFESVLKPIAAIIQLCMDNFTLFINYLWWASYCNNILVQMVYCIIIFNFWLHSLNLLRPLLPNVKFQSTLSLVLLDKICNSLLSLIHHYLLLSVLRDGFVVRDPEVFLPYDIVGLKLFGMGVHITEEIKWTITIIFVLTTEHLVAIPLSQV